MIMETSREFQKPLYMCFIDYSKAFDCVDHPKMWNVLRDMGIPEHLIILMRNLYSGQEATVRTEAGQTGWFTVGKGVRQGCILSPYLFNLYSENIMREAELEAAELGVQIGGRTITNLRYADDTTIIAESEADLKTLLRKIRDASIKQGLRLNLRKTKVMSTGNLAAFELDGDDIQVVDRFTFLGSEVAAVGGCSGEIRRRIALGRVAMNGLRPIMKDRGVLVKTKMRLVNVLVFPVVLYGSESWTMTKADRRRVDAFEMWCWRRVLRISWTERVTNKEVLARTSPHMSLEAMALKHKLSYFGHVMRAHGMERDLMLGKVTGKRRRGRQRTRWIAGVTSAMEGSLEELNERVKDRARWRRDVHWVTDSRTRLTG